MKGSESPEAKTAREVLAADGAYEVYRCAGGCVHLRLGSLTIRFSAGDYQRLARAMLDALVRMEVRTSLRRTPLWRQ